MKIASITHFPVYNPLWTHLYNGLQQCFITAFSWWVDYDNIGKDTFVFIFFRQYDFCFSYIKIDIFNAISFGIFFGILYSLWYDFHTIDMFCLSGKEE